MKICVVGSRDFSDKALLDEVLSSYFNEKDILVSGGARGADKLAEEWARKNKYKTKIFLPDWEKYGKSAGFKRNKTIVDNSDIVIAFWDGKSKGTANTISIAISTGKLEKIIRF